jgi:hypothetical protein
MPLVFFSCGKLSAAAVWKWSVFKWYEQDIPSNNPGEKSRDNNQNPQSKLGTCSKTRCQRAADLAYQVTGVLWLHSHVLDVRPRQIRLWIEDSDDRRRTQNHILHITRSIGIDKTVGIHESEVIVAAGRRMTVSTAACAGSIPAIHEGYQVNQITPFDEVDQSVLTLEVQLP